MNIGLVDVDSHKFPNLPLMKLSAWYKAKGDAVFLLKPRDVLVGMNLFLDYDILLGACVFTENGKLAERLEKCGVHVAGTGTGKAETLPDEIEHIRPDYSLYGITNTAYGFLSRGCPRRCPFCIVSAKEGAESRKVADLSEWWDGQKYIKLLDANILACPDHMNLLRQLAESGAWVDFTQGLDARLLNERNTELINSMKLKALHFAWDNPKDEATKRKLAWFSTRNKLHQRKRIVYCLTNFWSSHKENLERVYWLRSNGYDPYVMIYDKPHAPRNTRLLQRWVNNKRVFWKVPVFEAFDAEIA